MSMDTFPTICFYPIPCVWGLDAIALSSSNSLFLSSPLRVGIYAA